MGGATGAGQGQCVMELLPTCGQQVMELPVWPGRLVGELLRAAVGRVWELCTNTPTGLKFKMETTIPYTGISLVHTPPPGRHTRYIANHKQNWQCQLI